MFQLVRLNSLRFAASLAAVALVVATGCGTTRSSDTNRTATEQLLISDAVDRAIQSVSFASLAGQSVYLDDSKLADVVDKNYIVSTLRQHMLASGCVLKDVRDQADFIVEARAGAVGTDRNDLLFGIPATNVPQIVPLQGVPAAIPEVPLAKRRDQRGVARISMFAYQRQTGLPVWQSGLAVQESSSNDVWLFGAGPFQHGTIYEGPRAPGQGEQKIRTADDSTATKRMPVALSDEATFASPDKLVKQARRLPAPEAVATAPPLDPHATPTAPKTTPTSTASSAKVAAATPAATDASTPTDPQLPSFTVPTAAAQAKKATTTMSAAQTTVSPSQTTASVTHPADSQTAHNAAAKTADNTVSHPADPTALPQPRFDSL